MSAERARALVTELDEAVARFIAVVEEATAGEWDRIPAPGVWSIGKDVEHVGDAAVYHQWIVRLTIGEKVSSRRPALERQALTGSRGRGETLALAQRRAEESAALILGLSDDQLDLRTRPPRAKAAILADTIRAVLVGHYDAHRRDIEQKRR